VQRGRGGGDGEHVRVGVLVGRKHRGDDLHFVAEALFEHGADGPVDEAGDEGLALAGTADFAAEVAAGNAAGGVGHLLVIHGQGEEAAVDFQGLAHGGDVHDGAAGLEPDGSAGLFGHFAVLEGDFERARLGGQACGFKRYEHEALQWGFRVPPPLLARCLAGLGKGSCEVIARTLAAAN